MKIILVGNKSDLKEKKVVDTTNVQVSDDGKKQSYPKKFNVIII